MELVSENSARKGERGKEASAVHALSPRGGGGGVITEGVICSCTPTHPTETSALTSQWM